MRWNSEYSCVSAGDRCIVVSGNAREMWQFEGAKAELLDQRWGHAGPDPDQAEYFMRKYNVLIYPAWNELIVDLKEIGVVSGVESEGEERPTIKTETLSHGLPLPSFGRARGLSLLPRSGTLSFWLALVLSLTTFGVSWFLPVRNLFAIELFLGLGVGLVFALLLSTVGNLSALSRARVKGDLPIFRALSIRHLYALSAVQSGKSRLEWIGDIWVFQSIGAMVVLWLRLATGSAFSEGLWLGYLAALLFDLWPFSNGVAGQIFASVFGVSNFAHSVGDSILYLWLPNKYHNDSDAKLSDIKYLGLGIVGLAALVAVPWGLDKVLSPVWQRAFSAEGAEYGVYWLLVLGLVLAVFCLWFLGALVILAKNYFQLVRPRSTKEAPIQDADVPKVVQSLRKTILFHGTNDQDLRQLIASGTVVEAEEEAQVIQEGALGDAFFLILEGALSILKDRPGKAPLQLAVLGPGTGVGEIALLDNVPRTASAKTLIPTRLLRIKGSDFGTWLNQIGWNPQAARDRIRADQVLKFSPMFKGIDPEFPSMVWEKADIEDYASGSCLIKQGEQADSMFILLSGAVRIEVDGNPVAELAQGSIVGEMALLSGAPRSADVLAVQDVRVLKLTANAFWEILERFPAFRDSATELAQRRALETRF